MHCTKPRVWIHPPVPAPAHVHCTSGCCKPLVVPHSAAEPPHLSKAAGAARHSIPPIAWYYADTCQASPDSSSQPAVMLAYCGANTPTGACSTPQCSVPVVQTPAHMHAVTSNQQEHLLAPAYENTRTPPQRSSSLSETHTHCNIEAKPPAPHTSGPTEPYTCKSPSRHVRHMAHSAPCSTVCWRHDNWRQRKGKNMVTPVNPTGHGKLAKTYKATQRHKPPAGHYMGWQELQQALQQHQEDLKRPTPAHCRCWEYQGRWGEAGPTTKRCKAPAALGSHINTTTGNTSSDAKTQSRKCLSSRSAGSQIPKACQWQGSCADKVNQTRSTDRATQPIDTQPAAPS